MGLEALGAQPHALGTVEGHGPQVAVGKLVLAHDQLVGLIDGFPVEGHGHTHDLGGIEQPVRMLLQAENTGAAGIRVIGSDTFKNAHAIVQRMGEHMDLGFAPGHQLTIKPNKAVAVGKGHALFSSLNSQSPSNRCQTAVTACR